MNKLIIVFYFIAWALYLLISFSYRKPRAKTAEQSHEVKEKKGVM